LKNLLLVSAIVLSGFNAYGATARNVASSARVANGGTSTRFVTAPQQSQQARSVTNRGVATQPAVANTAMRGGRSASTTASASSARAAKQSVISTGTKVAAATQNTAVDQVCWEKFSGCMDAFCMLDNANGGRCICSDKNAEYDAILAEIQALDEQSYQMATVGVERIEMGDDADAVMSKTNAITKSIEQNAEKSKRQSLDLSAWDFNSIDFDADTEDLFSITSDGISIDNKQGDALYRSAAKLCNAQVPECTSQSKIMELMYQQRIRSDCTAYENSLRQSRTQSAQKLAAAQSAMREAALEQYRNANKYDLGQCTVQFKQCMQTTGGCGDDFAGCVEYSVREGLVNSNSKRSGKTKTIKGTSSKITLTAETYDVLESKKELCMNVTQQCVNVRDQVWDTFLREVAPQIKSAELIVESNMRTSCIANISNCFQKACRDNMDPNDPDGSYDMCLTRPETLRSACKVEIDPCEGGIPNIMDYVRARLASMRVDSCTREFKACLTSEDRCGKDYTQCIGLDTATIVEMCPEEKLPGCYYEYKDEKQSVQDTLAKIATGIFLNIDNNMLTACQKAVQSKVIEVCGSLSECDAFADDDVIGTDSLVSYKNSNGDTVIEGLMNYGLLKIDTDDDNNEPKEYKISDKAYSFLYESDGTTEKTNLGRVEQRIKSSVNSLSNKIKQKIDIIATDLTIDRCINGRDGGWRPDGTASDGRFPALLDSYTQMIFNSGLDKAYSNYHKKYTELVTQALEDQNDDVKSMLCSAIAYNAGSAYCTEYEAVDGEAVCVAYDAYPQMESIFDEKNARPGGRGSNRTDVNNNVNDGLTYVIQGANIAKKLENMSKGRGEFIQTDKDGNMMGKISMTSIYSPSTNTCTVTTTSTMCSTIEKVYTENKTSCFNTIQVAGGACNSGGLVQIGTNRTVTTQEYQGTVCTDYADPVITVSEIQL
jgi:hypothetical protein